MLTERGLERRPLVLEQRARARRFADGFLAVPGAVGPAWRRPPVPAAWGD
jgi:hypothetical protein